MIAAAFHGKMDKLVWDLARKVRTCAKKANIRRKQASSIEAWTEQGVNKIRAPLEKLRGACTEELDASRLEVVMANIATLEAVIYDGMVRSRKDNLETDIAKITQEALKPLLVEFVANVGGAINAVKQFRHLVALVDVIVIVQERQEVFKTSTTPPTTTTTTTTATTTRRTTPTTSAVDVGMAIGAAQEASTVLTIDVVKKLMQETCEQSVMSILQKFNLINPATRGNRGRLMSTTRGGDVQGAPQRPPSKNPATRRAPSPKRKNPPVAAQQQQPQGMMQTQHPPQKMREPKQPGPLQRRGAPKSQKGQKPPRQQQQQQQPLRQQWQYQQPLWDRPPQYNQHGPIFPQGERQAMNMRYPPQAYVQYDGYFPEGGPFQQRKQRRPQRWYGAGYQDPDGWRNPPSGNWRQQLNPRQS